MIRTTSTTPPRRRAVLAAAVTVPLLLAAACGRGGSSASTSAAVTSGGSAAASGSIVIAGSFPLSGPLSTLGAISKGAQAYFEKVNATGGVNGQKIEYKVNDDAYDPGRLAANARKGIEQDGAKIFMAFGGTNIAVMPYVNGKKVPHVVIAGNTAFSQTSKFPYTHAWWPDIAWERAITTKYALAQDPGAKIGLLSLNNDLADSELAGITKGGGKPALVLRVPPNIPDITSQVTQLKAAGVDTLFISLGGPSLVKSLQYMKQIGYTPKTFIYSGTASIKSTLAAVGLDKAKGLYTTAWLKDPADTQWASDSGVSTFKDDIAKYGQGADATDQQVLNGYTAAEAVVDTLKKAGSTDADAFNKAWDSLAGEKADGLLPGVDLTAGPGGRLVHSYRIAQFDGSSWKAVGDAQDAVKLGLTS